MYLSKRQLEEAIDQSNNSPTKLIRNLLTVFFTPSVLASSSCGGTRKFPCLNRDVIALVYVSLLIVCTSFIYIVLITYRLCAVTT